MSRRIGASMSDEAMRQWARDLKELAAGKEREALILERRADAVLAELRARQEA